MTTQNLPTGHLSTGELPATAVDVAQMIDGALSEGLPEPTAIITHYTTHVVAVHTTEQTWEMWRRWWNRHGAGPWTTRRTPVGSLALVTTVGHWRGWTVEVVHTIRGGAA